MNDGHATRVALDLDNLTHNLRLLQALVGDRALWPVIKANAYGHGARIVAPHLQTLGYETLCVAHVAEAAELREAGIDARLLVLSAAPPEHAQALVDHDCEAVVCTAETVEALASAAAAANRKVAVHVKVDTGMGRVGLHPDDAAAFLERCRTLPGLEVRGLMSHFARADEADKSSALAQLERFGRVARDAAVPVRHMANSAAIFDLPGSHLDAVRPGISIYGLRPSAEIVHPRVHDLRPVLEWTTRITYLKEVPANTGLSYGHAFHTKRPSLIATVPVGYGDGFPRVSSNRSAMLVHGIRCPQVGRVTMDQSLLDVTALRGRVRLGDEAVIIGRRGEADISADELATQTDTINYEVVTAIAHRVPRAARSTMGASHEG